MWSIISNNCWGANCYQELKIKYNTPTVGLWFEIDDYIEFLSDFRTIIKEPLNFVNSGLDGAKLYPIATLSNNIRIHFLHYESVDEARRKWEARVGRLPLSDDDLFVKICDRDGFEQRHLDAFARLPFIHKVGFFKRGRFDVSSYTWAIEVNSPYDVVADGVALWHQVRRERIFDAYSWLEIQQ